MAVITVESIKETLTAKLEAIHVVSDTNFITAYIYKKISKLVGLCSPLQKVAAKSLVLKKYLFIIAACLKFS